MQTPFVGRRRELARLDGQLDEVEVRGGLLVLVSGPPGVGKSALVRQFIAGKGDLLVLEATGAPGTDPPFGLLGRLFHQPCADWSAVPGEAITPADGSPAAGRRVLQTIAGLGQDRPVLLCIDDADRADEESLRAILFALRRLARHPVLTVLITSSDSRRLPDGLVRLAENGRTGIAVGVGPLRPADVRELAVAAGVPQLSLRTARRMCTHTGGNPRHLLALLAELPIEDWPGDEELPAPLAVSRAVARALNTCSEETRRLVEAVAVLGGQAVLSVAADVADVRDPLGALDGACAAGLLAKPRWEPMWFLTFADPLVHAAVRGQIGPAQSIRLRRAAAILGDHDSGEGSGFHPSPR